MARQSIIVLNSTGTDATTIGLPIRAAGYYGSGVNLHTVAIYLANFSGRVYIEATLASHPDEDDWFDVNLNDCTPYIQYPYDNNAPVNSNTTGFTGISSVSFSANFTYIRAKMDRGDLFLTYPPTQNFGSVQKILLNF